MEKGSSESQKQKTCKTLRGDDLILMSKLIFLAVVISLSVMQSTCSGEHCHRSSTEAGEDVGTQRVVEMGGQILQGPSPSHVVLNLEAQHRCHGQTSILHFTELGVFGCDAQGIEARV